MHLTLKQTVSKEQKKKNNKKGCNFYPNACIIELKLAGFF